MHRLAFVYTALTQVFEASTSDVVCEDVVI